MLVLAVLVAVLCVVALGVLWAGGVLIGDAYLRVIEDGARRARKKR